MNTRDVQHHLAAMGWPIAVDGSYGPRTREAVGDFQRGFAFWDLAVDGHAGPRTHAALRHAASHGGRASEHFAFREFASKGNGWIKLHRDLARALERMRELTGPLAIVNGYRDPAYNARVGGVSNSQHLYGNAVDVPRRLTLTQVRALGVFSGIGYRRSDGLVVHVDVRHVGPNPTGSSPAAPARWVYAS